MKKALFVFPLVLIFAATSFAQQNDAGGNIVLKAGTEISGQLQTTLDAETTKSSDDFVLILTADITGGGVTLPKGSEILGRVVSVKQISADDNESEISLSFDYLKYGDDYLKFKAIVVSIVPGNGESESAATNQQSSPKCTASAIFKGATIVSVKGKNLHLESGSVFRLKLHLDVKLN